MPLADFKKQVYCGRMIYFLISMILSAHAADFVYQPEHFKPTTARVVVVLHGCFQSSASMTLGTGMNLIADQENLAVIYPQAPEGSNAYDCWNWYEPENQTPTHGQLKDLRDRIQNVVTSLGLKNPKLYLMGLSAGGAEIAGLIACFPNDFTGAGIHSGVSYGLAQNVAEAETLLRDGPSGVSTQGPCHPADFKGRLIVIQGTADQVVHPSHADRIITDFVSSKPPTKKETVRDSSGLYTVADFTDMQGKTRGRLIQVSGLGHAWFGFKDNQRFPNLSTRVPYFTASGPNSTKLMWEYLKGQ